MEPGQDFYALCREYEKLGEGFLPNERRIKVGTREEDIIVKQYFLFKDKQNNPVVRLTFNSADNGGYWGKIDCSYDGIERFAFVPLDDLVSIEEIGSPIK